MIQSDTPNVIETVGLTKIFKDFWLRDKVVAVADLDMSVAPGEVFGLLGPNGSGKSTAIKMMLGLLFPTRGRVAVLGHRPTDVRVKARIGFLPEESYLYPFLNAVETLDYYGQLFHQPRRQRRRRVEMLLDMVGLDRVAYRRVGEYSKGMQRRIGLAQALINDPDLLILDEPTSGMDPIGARQFKDLILTLSGRGKSILLSSHLLGDVEDVCGRVCILYGGRIRAEGPIDSLLAQREKTQITASGLAAAGVDAVERAIRQAGGQVVSVETPRDRLEAMFLRIVEEAQEQKLPTGGATAGGGVAAFLRPEQAEGEALIRELVESAVAPAPAPVATPPAPAGPKVLDELVAPPEPARAPATPPIPAKPDKKVDRSVIDGLLDGEDGPA